MRAVRGPAHDQHLSGVLPSLRPSQETFMLIPLKPAFEIASKVLQKAQSDPAFRALALKDGTAAVEQLTGKPLPDGLKIQFVDSPRGTITVGLPPAKSDEL